MNCLVIYTEKKAGSTEGLEGEAKEIASLVALTPFYYIYSSNSVRD